MHPLNTESDRPCAETTQLGDCAIYSENTDLLSCMLIVWAPMVGRSHPLFSRRTALILLKWLWGDPSLMAGVQVSHSSNYIVTKQGLAMREAKFWWYLQQLEVCHQTTAGRHKAIFCNLWICCGISSLAIREASNKEKDLSLGHFNRAKDD